MNPIELCSTIFRFAGQDTYSVTDFTDFTDYDQTMHEYIIRIVKKHGVKINQK